MLKIDQLTFSYGGDFSLNIEALTIEPGVIHGLFGSNGSGKTTFIKSLLGVISADKYDVSPNLTLPAEKSCIAALLEGADLVYPELTVALNAEYIATLRGANGAKRNVITFAKSLKFESNLDTPVSKLSTGNKRMASLLSLLSSEPEFLFLDEPTLGLDIAAAERVKTVLKDMKKKGTTILITSHDVNFVKDTVDVYHFIEDGELRSKNRSIESLDEILEQLKLNA